LTSRLRCLGTLDLQIPGVQAGNDWDLEVSYELTVDLD
jgi:hypothetical protein